MPRYHTGSRPNTFVTWGLMAVIIHSCAIPAPLGTTLAPKAKLTPQVTEGSGLGRGRT